MSEIQSENHRKTDIKSMDLAELKAMADRVRRSVVDMAHAAGAGGSHLGGGLSCVEIMTALYGGVFKFDVENPTDINRDRFLTGKAHCILTQYSVMQEMGIITEEEFSNKKAELLTKL